MNNNNLIKNVINLKCFLFKKINYYYYALNCYFIKNQLSISDISFLYKIIIYLSKMSLMCIIIYIVEIY